MYRWYICGILAAFIGLTGCRTSQSAGRVRPQARPLGKQLSTSHAPVGPENGAAARDREAPAPSGELTLRKAMAATLLRNPGLQAFSRDLRAAEARIVEAGLWDNPEVEVEFDEFGGTGDFAGTNALETAVSLGQTFPLGGDIERRRELAGYRAELAGWDYEAARVAALTELTQRYVAVLAARRRLNVAREALQIARDVKETTRKRIEAGAAPRIELVRASVTVATSKVDFRRAERLHQSARRQLSLMWNQSDPGFDKVAGDLEKVHTPPEPGVLVSLINQNPEVARWAAKISARQAEASLARAESIPDVTGRIGVKRLGEIDETAFVAGLSLPLPVFDRNQGKVRASRLKEVAARRRRRETEVRLERRLSAAYSRLANSYDEVVAIRQEALPPAREAFDLTENAFQKGDLGFLDVLDAERTLVELRTRYVEALVTYHEAAAEIEGLIAQSLRNVSDVTESQPSTKRGSQE